ncbi:MAG: hypothetical protein OEL83_09935 [Desulforhopalus sp.]|nr:hypothetical protein [Desulforhopalus sp.]
MITDKTHVTIYTKDFAIKGDIDLIPGARLTDYMNEVKRFMAVTGATISDHSGREIAKSQFINVAVDNIQIIRPAGPSE